MSTHQDGRLAGKVAIVTGGGRGLGRAESLALAQAGASVVVNDLGTEVESITRDRGVAQAAADEITALGAKAVANGDDISTVSGARAAVAAAMDAFGRIDILINNAGVTRPKTIDRMTEEDWDVVIKVSLRGSFLMTREVAPILIRQKTGGVIINTASTSGLGHYGNSSYSAAKEGLVGFTRTVARDLGHHGIRCNAIRPLGISRLATPEMMETLRVSQEDLGIPGNGNMWMKDTGGIPLPEQVGVFVAWLATDAASNVNGRTFFVGGGTVALYPEPEPLRSAFQPEGWTLDSLDRSARDYLIGDLVNAFTGKNR